MPCFIKFRTLSGVTSFAGEPFELAKRNTNKWTCTGTSLMWPRGSHTTIVRTDRMALQHAFGCYVHMRPRWLLVVCVCSVDGWRQPRGPSVRGLLYSAIGPITLPGDALVSIACLWRVLRYRRMSCYTVLAGCLRLATYTITTPPSYACAALHSTILSLSGQNDIYKGMVHSPA